MILVLDHWIFGNGHGMKSPYFDDKFYWLTDGGRALPGASGGGESGQLYTFMPGLGAQLHSYQWTHPNAGEERMLLGRRFRPLHSTRRWGRVEVAWAMQGPKDIDAIRLLKTDLDNL